MQNHMKSSHLVLIQHGTQYTPTDPPTEPNKHGRIVMRECVIWSFFALFFFPLLELSFYLPKYFQCVACMHVNLCVVNYRSNDENACQTHIKHTHSLLKQTWKILSDGIVIRLICSTFFSSLLSIAFLLCFAFANVLSSFGILNFFFYLPHVSTSGLNRN